MKKKILITSAFVIVSITSFIVGTKVNNNNNKSISIPISDIAEMTIDEYDYYQIEIGDTIYVDGNKNNISYDEIFKIVNDR